MSDEQPISRALALRIGLAARAVPELEPRQLVGALLRLLGPSLTEEGVAGVTADDLRRAGEALQLDGLAGAPEAVREQVCRRLQGEGEEAASAVPEPSGTAPLPGAIRVACTSNAGTALDGHFGSCARFLVYEVNRAEARLAAVRSALEAGRGQGSGIGEKSAARAALIADCHLLYTRSIGGPAAAKVVRRGIHPVKLPDGGDADGLMAELAEVLADRPPPWLAKVMGAALPVDLSASAP